MKSLFCVVTVSLLFHKILVIQQQEPITPRVVFATQHFTTEPFIFRSIFPQIKATVINGHLSTMALYFSPRGKIHVYTCFNVSTMANYNYLASDGGITGFPNSSQQKNAGSKMVNFMFWWCMPFSLFIINMLEMHIFIHTPVELPFLWFNNSKLQLRLN